MHRPAAWKLGVRAEPGARQPAASTLTIDVNNGGQNSDRRPRRHDRSARHSRADGQAFFFVDKGVNRGIVADAFKVFEDDLNKKLAAENKLKNRT
jgi:hypothetical protein